LEKFGYKGVNTAEDGRVAVNAAAKADYDLILMDLQVGSHGVGDMTCQTLMVQRDILDADNGWIHSSKHHLPKRSSQLSGHSRPHRQH